MPPLRPAIQRIGPGRQDLVTRGGGRADINRPRPAPGQTQGSGGKQGKPQAQPPKPQGLLQQVGSSVSNPLDLSGQPAIREQNIINPSARPVDVPDPTQLGVTPERVQPGQITQGPEAGPVAQAPSVHQQRQFNPAVRNVAPGQVFQPPSDVSGVRASQRGQYSMNANNQAVDPSQTQQFDPNSGRYFQGPDPNGFGPQGDQLEQATFQRGVNRIDPYLQEQRQGISQRLQNQGLPVGSEAYNQEMNRFEQSRGDQLENLALSSVGAGRQEQGRLFGQDLASRQFGAGEAGRQFGERLGATQFNAGEAGRGFRENLASQQNQFGQNLAANQFNAGESGRRFGELSHSQAQEHGINLANRRFSQSESARNFGERLSGNQNQYNQQLGAARFGAGQDQQNFQNRLGAAQFGAGRQDANFGQQLAGAQFGAGQQQQQFGQQLAGQGQNFNQGLQQGQFNAGQQQQGFQNNMANQQLLGQNDSFLAQQQANQFSQDMARRQLGTSEQLLQRQQPLNELSQILGMSGQVGNPQFSPTSQFGPQNVDYSGLTQNQYLGDLNAYNQRQANIWGAIGGVGSAVMPFLPGNRGRQGG